MELPRLRRTYIDQQPLTSPDLAHRVQRKVVCDPEILYRKDHGTLLYRMRIQTSARFSEEQVRHASLILGLEPVELEHILQASAVPRERQTRSAITPAATQSSHTIYHDNGHSSIGQSVTDNHSDGPDMGLSGAGLNEHLVPPNASADFDLSLPGLEFLGLPCNEIAAQHHMFVAQPEIASGSLSTQLSLDISLNPHPILPGKERSRTAVTQVSPAVELFSHPVPEQHRGSTSDSPEELYQASERNSSVVSVEGPVLVWPSKTWVLPARVCSCFVSLI